MTRPVPEEKLRLGGMALRNGLLVHGPTHWAAAVRGKDGKVQVASGRKPDFGSSATEKLPGVRGITKLAEAFAVIPLVKRSLPAAQLPMQDVKTLGAIAGAAAAGRALRGKGGKAPRTLGREAAVGMVSLIPAIAALRTGDLASYHGVEHKSIAAYEDDGQAADASKEHDRCGSNLVAPMLATTALGNVAVRRAGFSGPAAESAVALGSMAVAVEVFVWSERHADSLLARLLRRPGHEIQRAVGTREPTEEQLEVGRAALDEILRVEERGAQPPTHGPSLLDRRAGCGGTSRSSARSGLAVRRERARGNAVVAAGRELGVELAALDPLDDGLARDADAVGDLGRRVPALAQLEEDGLAASRQHLSEGEHLGLAPGGVELVPEPVKNLASLLGRHPAPQYQPGQRGRAALTSPRWQRPPPASGSRPRSSGCPSTRSATATTRTPTSTSRSRCSRSSTAAPR